MKQYHDLLLAIAATGSYKEPAREGMPGSLSLFGYQNRYNLGNGFPIVTTKKMFWRGIVEELLWFLRGDTNIKYLDEKNITKMWHQDAYNFYLMNFKSKITYGGTSEEEKLSFEDFCKIIRDTKREDLPKLTVSPDVGALTTYTLGDCGFQYGRTWRSWPTGRSIVVGHNGMHNEFGMIVVDQIANVIESIKATPYGRRHLVTAVDPAHDKELALYWCHALFQFNCRRIKLKDRFKIYDAIPRDQKASLSSDKFGGSDIERHADLDNEGVPGYYLDCQLYQRSADSYLGVPFNISSYALLTMMIAKICNMVPGEFIHTFGDVHIYDNHVNAIKEQLLRDPHKYQLPTLRFNSEINWTYISTTHDFNSLTAEDFILDNYESYPKIEAVAELTTGLKRT